MGNKLLYIISPSHLLCFAGVEGVPKKQMNFLGRVFSCGVGGVGLGSDRDIWPSSCKLKQYKICAYMYVLLY